jgi:hypothetical protein
MTCCRVTTAWIVAALVTVLGSGTARACVGTACMEIWSTADGALTIQWDFVNKKVQTLVVGSIDPITQMFQNFCTPDSPQCLYSTADPGFMAPTTDPDPADSYFVLRDATAVHLVIVAADPGLSLNINGRKLYQPGDTALLGTTPGIHNHPSWLLGVRGDQVGDFQISFKLTADSSDYAESEVFTAIVTNVAPPEGTPTPTASSGPTPVPTPCAGDCNSDGSVTIAELVLCVNMALGSAAEDACMACDANGDGSIAINEIIAAVSAALNGCPKPPPATLAEIQAMIFTPTCATQFCHDAQSAIESLDLSAGASYSQLVNVSPTVFAARSAGLLRVKPGDPDQSFLMIKLLGPPLDEGSRMPLTGSPLNSQQLELIRNWILQGANP